MELRLLRYFLAVAEEGSFTKAADRLHVSQPAFSQQLAKLEDEIGGKLFLRTSRRCELTEKATLLIAAPTTSSTMPEKMVKAGLGAAISINEILSDDTGLVFRPFDTLNSLNASLKIAL